MTTYQTPPQTTGPDAPPPETTNTPDPQPQAKPQPGQEWQQPGQETPRPEWLPEKFKTPEDMAKAYAELEAKQGGQKTETPKAADGTEAKPESALDDNGINAALQAHNLDLSTFTSEFEQNGALTEDSYKKLEAAGYPKAFVDEVIRVRAAEGDRMVSDVHNAVGGEENYAAITGWAAANLDRSELEAFNTAIESGNAGSVKMMLQGMKAAYEAANGQDPNLLGGAKATGAQGFANMRQMTTAMRDSRYGKDSQYDAWVDMMIKNAAF